MARRVLIIEPHADDALFSLMHVLQDPEVSATIITCCTHEDGRSSEELQSILNSVKDVYKLPLSEENYLWSSKTFTHHDVNRLTENSYEWTRDQVKIARSEYNADRARIKSEIEVIFKSLTRSEKFDEIYVPIGVVHPWHIIVADACDQLFKRTHREDLIYYAERPYTHKKFCRKIMNDFKEIIGSQFVEVESEYDGSSKEKFINECYPGELQQFHWDIDKILELPEMVLRKE